MSPTGSKITALARSSGSEDSVVRSDSRGFGVAGVAAQRGYRFGRFRLDPTERVLFLDDRAISLPPKAADTLLLLVQNAGHVVEKRDLLKAIAALRSGAEGSMLFDFKNQKWVELETRPATFPNWSQDGSHVYFHSIGSDAALYRVRTGDRELEKIASLTGIRLTIGVIGTWCGLAPEDSPLILRDVGSQEIYALDLQLP